MAFDEFKKEDLDFSGLVAAPKKKKLPKPSEGLRFLERNLRKDFEVRNLPKKNVAHPKKKTALPSSNQNKTKDFPQQDGVSNTSIDNNDTAGAQEGVLKMTIDESNTRHAVLKTSIDDNTTPSPVSKVSIDIIDTARDADLDFKGNHFIEAEENISRDKDDPRYRQNNSAVSNSVRFNQNKPISANGNQTISQDKRTKSDVSETSIDKNGTACPKPSVSHSSIDNNDTAKQTAGVSIPSIDVNNTPSSVFKSSIDEIDTDVLRSDSSIYTTIIKSRFTKLTNNIFKILPNLSKTEQIIFLFFYRNSFGWNKQIG